MREILRRRTCCWGETFDDIEALIFIEKHNFPMRIHRKAFVMLSFNSLFDEVMLDLMVELNDRVYIGFHSSAPNQTVFEFAAASVKDKLLEAGINMLSATNWINFWARIEHAFAPERIGSKVPIWSGQCHQSIVQRQKWEIFKCRSCRT